MNEQQTVTIAEIEEESELAADFIEELLDIADLDGDLEIEISERRAIISVSAEEDVLIDLSKTDAVTALQEIVRLVVQNKTGRYSRLVLDIGGSRKKREGELARLVERAVERLDAGASFAELPPMSSYERKIIHSLVAERGYSSESKGEGAQRRTIIRPA
ncbi:MAG: DNA-binding protein [Microbacteriaceae bacterium]|nr:DNA-binding protein [Microbacteriaceae bacterium]